MFDQAIRYLILPGWQGSPANHWQSHWQHCLPNAQRVEQIDWESPKRQDWVKQLESHILTERTPTVLIAHSLGCITIAHWAAQATPALHQRIRGALLVAPADVERTDCPESLKNFAPIPQQKLPFPSLLVGSDDDPAATPIRALTLAEHWGSEAAILVGVGHINVKSGHCCWEQGFTHLFRLQSIIETQARHCA